MLHSVGLTAAAPPVAQCALQLRCFATATSWQSKRDQNSRYQHLRSPTIRTGYENILKAFGLDQLSIDSDSGIHIDERGCLQISSEEEGRKKRKTALLLSRAPLSLTDKDFYSLLKKGRHLPGWRSHGGLEKVVPWRHSDSLKRDNRWILLFSTPADAARYQQRVIALRAFVRGNTPTTPISKPAPPSNYEAPEVPGFTLGDYTITPPFQHPAIYAFMQPFPRQILEMINTQRYFMSYTDTGAMKYAVRLWMDNKSPFLLNQYLIKEWLYRDGRERHVPWQLAENDEPIQPLSDDPEGDLLAPPMTSNAVVLDYQKCHNWLIFFKSAGEARRFVRIFHRTPLPKFRHVAEWDPMPLIKAELMLESTL